MWVQYIGKVNVYYKSISLKNIFKKKEKKQLTILKAFYIFYENFIIFFIKKNSLLTNT